MNCRNIRRLIDEADGPDSIPLEAARHAGSCVDCASFADERFRLRRLLSSSSRVAAPANFDAILREKLAHPRIPTRLGWLTLGFSLKLAGAAATLAIAIFATQFYQAGGKPTVIGDKTGANQDGSEIARVDNSSLPAPGNNLHTNHGAAATPSLAPASNIDEAFKSGKGYSRHLASSRVRSGFERGFEQVEAAAVLLTRDHLSERQFTVSAISVGAQPIVSFDGDRQTARIVRTSF